LKINLRNGMDDIGNSLINPDQEKWILLEPESQANSPGHGDSL
jgi:hypothetical protein